MVLGRQREDEHGDVGSPRVGFLQGCETLGEVVLSLRPTTPALQNIRKASGVCQVSGSPHWSWTHCVAQGDFVRPNLLPWPLGLEVLG